LRREKARPRRAAGGEAGRQAVFGVCVGAGRVRQERCVRPAASGPVV
jgi:hypothetical protein